MKKLVTSLMYYVISAIGISLTIKAAIGVSSFNSLNVSLSNLTSIKVGTITSIINLLFMIGCIVLDKNRKLSKYALMFFATISFGMVINVVYYYLFAHIQLTNYLMKLVVFLLGVTLAGFGTGQVVRINLLTFPIESLCQLLDSKTNYSFSTYRYAVDIICVAFSLFISLYFSLPIVVREGTILSLFLLSGVISWSKEFNWKK